MANKHSPIQLIINKLGYKESSNLFYYTNIDNKQFTTHTNKILNELKPYAFYCIDKNPFILFYSTNDIDAELHKKIWNSQIPITFISDENNLRIYNSSALDLEEKKLDLVFNTKLDECDEFSEFSYWNITSDNFWNDFSEKFSKKKFNELLFENIEYITDYLKNELKVKFATKIILRVIFIRYLIDRGVDLDYKKIEGDIKNSQTLFLIAVSNKESLYSLFSHLKNKFHGNLFDFENELEDENLTDTVFKVLSDFLSGIIDLKNKQLALFPLYDFNIISVELISNIYEILLGKTIQKNDMAFYTPNYLVDYILSQTVDGFLLENDEFKILDPSCGSGIFLVECYRRIIERKLEDKSFCSNDSLLQNLLVNNIFGVDINEDAIDITMFSLYLTLLDYKDPKTLTECELPNIKGANLFVSDFFDDEKLKKLKTKDFDFIIGNPPWGKKKGLHNNYCKNESKPNHNEEISRSFVYKLYDFCNKETQCCLVLPSKLFYNKKQPSILFRKHILKNTIINKIIELSSVRKLVFKNANAPATIMFFQYKNKENALKNKILYTSMKPNVFFKLFNIIVVEKNDIKFIKQEILLAYDWAWKTMVYGSSMDFDLIRNLLKSYPSINKAISEAEPKFIQSTGVQYNNGEKDATEFSGKTLLNSNTGMDSFAVYIENSEIFSKKKIHRTRNIELFNPPYCLLKKGPDCTTYKMKAAYSEEEFVAKETFYFIKGSFEQKDILLNLTGLFNSSFFAYLNLMLGSSFGIEREQRFVKEVFSFPYIFNKKIFEKVQTIQELKESNDFNSIELEENIKTLDDIVLSSYGLKYNNYIDYAINVQIPQLTSLNNKTVSYRSVKVKELKEYARIFYEYFSNIFNSKDVFVKTRIYPNVVRKYSIFELILDNKKPEKTIEIANEAEKEKSYLTKFSIYKANDYFYHFRNVLSFNESSFFIIKTNEYKNWHPAIAEVDLNEVIEQVLSNS